MGIHILSIYVLAVLYVQQVYMNRNINVTSTDQQETTTRTNSRTKFEQRLERPNRPTSIKLFLGLHVDRCYDFECSSLLSDCLCDPECLLYGDCCYEYIEQLLRNKTDDESEMADYLQNRTALYHSKATTDTFAKELFIYQHSACILADAGLDSYWMINKCPNDFADETTVEKCEEGTKFDIYNIPIEWTDQQGRLWLFRNIFCVLCHGIDLETPSLEKWKVELFCEKTVKTVNVLPSGAVNLLHPGPDCYLKLSPPSLISKHQQRKCQGTNVIKTTCPSTPDLLSYKLFCDSYVYLVTSNEILYRNPHCTACYNASMNYYVDCLRGNIHENSERAVDLKLLFDFNPSTGYTVTATCQQYKSCLSFEIYDCISHRCRNFYCPAYQKAYFGKCIASNWTDGDNYWHEATLPSDSENPRTHIIFVQIELITPNPILVEEITEYLRMSEYVEDIYSISMEEEILNFDVDEPNPEEEFVEHNSDQDTDDTDKGVDSDEPNTGVSGDFPDPFLQNTQFLFIYTATITVKDHTISAANDLLKTLKHHTEKWFIITNLEVKIRSYTDLYNLHCDRGNLTVLFNVSYAEDLTEVNVIENQTKISINSIFWALSGESTEKKTFDTIAVCLSRHQIPILNCSITVYEGDEVLFLNTTMYVKNTSLAFEQSEYEMIGSKIFVCADRLVTQTYLRFFNYSRLQRILSIVTSCISLVCLMSICIMHVIFSKLRNNHGLNLFALSTSMLLVQGMLLFENIPAGDICLSYAVCLHFLVLNMFVWMNVIGFDMAITFHSKTMTKMANTGRFLKYCFVSVILPLVCIGICVILDVSHAQFGPDYGADGICWLTNSGSIIIFFTVPIFVSISVNLVLFSIVLYSIQTTRVKSSVRTNVRNRTYSLVYFKMSIILGFTWAVGIIAAFVSVEWLWYVHIVLNGLQGLSLFLCSMVNARTVRVLKERTQTITISDTKSSRVGT